MADENGVAMSDRSPVPEDTHDQLIAGTYCDKGTLLLPSEFDDFIPKIANTCFDLGMKEKFYYHFVPTFQGAKQDKVCDDQLKPPYSTKDNNNINATILTYFIEGNCLRRQ
jgi:hypothetical protein